MGFAPSPLTQIDGRPRALSSDPVLILIPSILGINNTSKLSADTRRIRDSERVVSSFVPVLSRLHLTLS